ncbi:Uncharacterized protein HZ326_11878 [Fusarium oxysporum f. sp. albedinis]|nr:Uncharacterized protein HZ326_11878 [Fusarium oxysporum f. sp. albedinis]
MLIASMMSMVMVSVSENKQVHHSQTSSPSPSPSSLQPPSSQPQQTPSTVETAPQSIPSANGSATTPASAKTQSSTPPAQSKNKPKPLPSKKSQTVTTGAKSLTTTSTSTGLKNAARVLSRISCFPGWEKLLLGSLYPYLDENGVKIIAVNAENFDDQKDYNGQPFKRAIEVSSFNSDWVNDSIMTRQYQITVSCFDPACFCS